MITHKICSSLVVAPLRQQISIQQNKPFQLMQKYIGKPVVLCETLLSPYSLCAKLEFRNRFLFSIRAANFGIMEGYN